MRLLIQRVSSCAVDVEEKRIAEIGHGLLILVGAAHGDTEETARTMALKSARLRIFPDSSGKMNLSVQEAGGGVVVVSQFTLYADTSRGRRPSFVQAARPDIARSVVEAFCLQLESLGLRVGRGSFGAHMKVHLVNDGPVTIALDSER